jgi:CheY-like chemotaxis protein
MTQRVLIVEDNIADMKTLASVLAKMGVLDVEATTNIAKALLWLQEVVEGRRPAFELILLDLSFPHESGFEVLRFWKSNPQLKDIRILVWTSMGETEVELVKYFGVEVVAKWAGAGELEEMLRKYLRLQGQRTSAT